MINELVRNLEYCDNHNYDDGTITVEIKKIAGYYAKVGDNLLEVTHMMSYADEEIRVKNLLIATKTRRLDDVEYKTVVIGTGNPKLSHSTFSPLLRNNPVRSRVMDYLELEFTVAQDIKLVEFDLIGFDRFVLGTSLYEFSRWDNTTKSNSKDSLRIKVYESDDNYNIDTTNPTREYIGTRDHRNIIIVFTSTSSEPITEEVNDELLEILEIVWLRANNLL